MAKADCEMDYLSEGKITRSVIGKSAPESQRSFFKWACMGLPVAMCLGRAGDSPVACCAGGGLLRAADLGVAVQPGAQFSLSQGKQYE